MPSNTTSDSFGNYSASLQNSICNESTAIEVRIQIKRRKKNHWAKLNQDDD